MTEGITISRVEPKDLKTLLFFSVKTFFDAFYHLNNADDMETYAARYFTKQQMETELNNPLSQFYFARLNQEIVGYIKLNYAQAQSDIKDPKALEVERIYIDADHQNKKIGKQLIDFAINTAINNQLQYIWLGVWEHNHKAIKFYEKNGFEAFGKHDFMLGSDLQVDVLMRLPLPILPN